MSFTHERKYDLRRGSNPSYQDIACVDVLATVIRVMESKRFTVRFNIVRLFQLHDIFFILPSFDIRYQRALDLRTRFEVYLKVFAVVLKKRHPGKLHFAFFF